MADRSGPDLTSPDKIFLLNQDGRNNTKKKRMNELMDLLRNRNKPGTNGRCRTWNEAAKVLRMSMTDKKHQIEASEKQKISMHLSVLQCAFKVNSQKSMLERIEQLCQDLSLNFTKGTSAQANADHVQVFISSVDLFYLELLIDHQGIVIDVKLCHGGEPMRCMEIVKLLNESKFEEFREHLDGILAIYNITADKKMKNKAFTALQSLETDLNNLSKLQCTITSVPNFIHKSPLGILIPRVGGTPMKLVYFVGPYDLLDKKSKTSKPMTIEGITENDLGHSVTVTLEPSSAQKLQTMSLMTVNKTHDGKSLPCFAPVNNMNSTVLNAIFVLKLHKKMAMTCSVLQAIQKTTEVEFESELTVKSFVKVLVEQMLGEKGQNFSDTEGLHVNLPDQNQRFFLSCQNGCDQQGALVDKIPFFHPTSVPTVIKYLRQQALFNTVLGSCVRNTSSQDIGHQLTFDVTPLNLQTVSVSFEHPFTDAIATADLDLSDITSLRCRISSMRLDSGECNGETTPAEICSDEAATKIFQRCLSLPITLRSVFHEADNRMDQHFAAIPASPPPPVIKPKPLFCLQTLQNNTLPLSKKGKERRVAFMNAAANHREKNKIVSLNSSFLGASGNSLLPGVTQASMTVTTITTTMSVPPPKYHQAVATTTMSAHKAGPVVSSNIKTPVSANSREVTVISPEIISAYESGLIDSTHATKETLEYIKKDKITKNPMLASLLDQERDSPENVVSQASMLSALLVSDASHVGHTTQAINNQASMVSATDMPVPKHTMPAVGLHGNQSQVHHHQHQQMLAHHQQHHQQQQHSQKALQQKPRKRKSTGENKIMNSGPGGHNTFNTSSIPMSNANNNMGRSPKRLLSEDDHIFSTFSPISSAENDPSQPSPLGHGHHHHPMPIGATNHTLDGLHSLGPGTPSQLANFQSQTRVGGADPPFSVVSSSVAMVTESNQCHSISPKAATNQSPSFVPVGNALTPHPLTSTVSSNKVVPSQSPIFCLSSSLDSLLKSEQKALSSVTSSSSNVLLNSTTSGTTVIKEEKFSGHSSSSTTSSKYNELLTLLNDGSSGEGVVGTVRRPSIGPVSTAAGQKLDRQDSLSVKRESTTAALHQHHHSNTLASLAGGGLGRLTQASDIKKEDNISLSMECESIDAPTKDRGFLDYKNATSSSSGSGGGVKDKRPRSAESDPFEFNDCTFDNSYSVGSTELSDVSLEFEEENSSSRITTKYTTPTAAAASTTTKVTNNKERINSSMEYSVVDYNPSRKERKKSRVDTKEYSIEENKKGVLGITMKINAKDGSAKTIVKQSPLHHNSQEYELIGSSRKWKESRSRYSGSVADRMSDNSMDGDVFVMLSNNESSSEKGKHHHHHHHHNQSSGGQSTGGVYNHHSNSMNSVGGGEGVSPRILSSKKQGSTSECMYGGGKPSSDGVVGFVTKEKKKKSSKVGSESKQEKKRKRAAEAREKDQLIKKQKVYDFDFNESEHLPPTKIKIRTSDGKIQIQTDSMKTYSMSPLPMKPDCSSPTVGNSSGSSKRHKSEKSVKHKKDKSDKDKYNRSRSEPQGKADKNDSKLYNKRPVVKIKPLENTSSGVTSVSSTSSMLPVSIATVQGATKVITPSQSTLSPHSASVTKLSPLVTSVANPGGLEATSNLTSAQKQLKEVSSLTLKGSSVVIRDHVTAAGAAADASVKSTKENCPSIVSVSLKTNKESSISSTGVPRNSKDPTLPAVVVSSKASKESTTIVSGSLKNNKDSTGNMLVKSSKEPASNTSSVLKSSSIKPVQPASSTTTLKPSKDDSLPASVAMDKVKVTGYSSTNTGLSAVGDQVKVKQSATTISESTKNGHTSQPGASQTFVNEVSVKAKAEQDRKRSVSVAAGRGSPVLSSGGPPGDRARSLSEKMTSSSSISVEKQKVKVTNTSNSLDKEAMVKVKVVQLNDLQSKAKVVVKESEGKPTKDKTASVKEGSEGQVKPKSKVVTKEGEAQVKSKNEKTSSGDPQKKQRKGSLTAVIDKLKKGFTENVDKPKKSQNMYDAIRREILKAGDNKSTTLPIAKIGKKAKQDTPVQTSKPVSTSSNQSGPVTGQKVTANASNPKPTSSPGQNPKVSASQKTSVIHKGANSVLDGILHKRAPSTNFRIPKTDSKSGISSKAEGSDHVTKGPALQAGNTGNSGPTKSGYGQTPGAGTPVNHVISKNSSGPQANQLNRQTSKEPEKSKRLKVDDISEKLQSRHFLDAVDTMSKEESGVGGGNGVGDKKIVNSSQVQNKGNKSANRTESNPKDPRTWNSHYNNTLNDGVPRSKSPVVGNNVSKLEKGPLINTSPSVGGGGGGGGHGNSNTTASINKAVVLNSSSNPRMNNQSYSSSQKVPPSKPARPSVVENKKHINHLLDQPKLIPINKRDPRVGGSASKEGSASPQPGVSNATTTGTGGSTSSNQGISYYNPAEALGRKGSSSSTAVEAIAKQPPPPQASSIRKDTSGRTKVTVISESPASPTEKPGQTIRHDTPPASPILNADVSDNKENLAKSIPLDEDKKRVFTAPTPPKPLAKVEDATPRHATKAIISTAATSHSGFDKTKGESSIKQIPSKPSSDPSSPEDCVITEVSATIHAKPPNSKAPVTIPLERSRSKSPNDRSRSPLTPRSPVQASPKDRASLSPALSKTQNPGSPCKALKMGREDIISSIQSPVSTAKTTLSCNPIEEDDLMNDALIL